MLDNYARNEAGVIYQIKRNKFIYDEQYIVRAFGNAPVQAMSHLRLGYLIGSIGHVPESILDVGYGTGDFLKVAAKVVPEIYGYDVPPVYPVTDIPLVETLFGRRYEVVTFFDSLEHFEDINCIRELQARYVLVSLPWCHYFSDEWFAGWKHRKPDEHLWHFDANSLIRFMGDLGYRVINYSNVEDTIRTPDGDWQNILSAVFMEQ